MDEYEQMTRNRFGELADRARQSGIYTYTGFHSLRTAGLAYDIAPEREVSLWGGARECERVVVRFGDPQELGYEEDFPIRILCVKPKQEKFADDLSHRDFLGAVLNLGIERDVIGDILVDRNSAYVLCLEGMADFICENLERVRHTSVTCSLAEQVPPDALPKLCEEHVTVSSPRLDAVLAKVYHLSRGEAKARFEEDKVLVNGRICRSPETMLKEACGITVRGLGRLEYRGEERATKKGKTGITVWRYV